MKSAKKSAKAANDLEISFSSSPHNLIETEDTVLTFRFELSEAPPAQGIEVTVRGNIPESLNQLDLFDIEVMGADYPIGDFDFSGFSLNLTSRVATVSIPVFLDDDSDAIVNNSTVDPDDYSVTYTLRGGEDYTVDPQRKSTTVSFFDTLADLPTNRSDRYEGNRFPNQIDGLGGKDVLKGKGGNDTLNGGNGNDKIFGEDNKDRLLGGNGNDILSGGNGNDILIGGKNRDTLIGGKGRDNLTGGAGNDVFRLENNTSSSSQDRILDYVDGVDKFQLSGGLSFDDLTIDRVGDNTRFRQGRITLAIVEDIAPGAIRENDFI
ncbi:MAG: calcium-binding protein [Cyanobacteria bacterium J06623_7]